jgi:predicted Zn-dependent protease
MSSNSDRGRSNGRRRPSRSGRPPTGRSRTGREPSKGAHSDRDAPTRSTPPKRKPWSPEGDLPKWISEELARVTPKKNIAAATDLLQASARAFAAGKHGKALKAAEEAKELSPRDPTIRELIGLSAYRMSRWDHALRELRTFRRLTGDATHLPVEMDVLRALDRPSDIETAWKLFRGLRADRETQDEARVVYGSFLLDRGEDRRAWEITNPKRMSNDPGESELRVWYVAARAAARLGDKKTARQLLDAIRGTDPAFPGLGDLERAVEA